MPWVAVDENGMERIGHYKAVRENGRWLNAIMYTAYGPQFRIPANMPSGSIERLIGRRLTWEHEPVELTEATLAKPVEVTDEISEYEAITQQERRNPHLTHTQEYVHFRNGFFDCWNWMSERMKK